MAGNADLPSRVIGVRVSCHNAEMNDWSLPNGLPRGRLIVPDASSVEGSPVEEPVLWVSDAPVRQPAELWVALRLQHPQTGLWPLVLETLEDAPARPWHDGELAPVTKPLGDGPDVDRVLLTLWTNCHEDDADETTASIEWPGLAARGEPGDPPEAVADRVVREAFRGESLVGLVPADSGAGAVVACGWEGPANHASTPDIAVVLRSWEDRFGVRLLGLGFDTMTVSVAAPPLTIEHALGIAAEHFAFCPDNVWQGEHETLAEYAEALVGSDSWFFWWD